MELSADAVYLVLAGRALHERARAEVAAAAVELQEQQTVIETLRDQVARLEQNNNEIQSRALRFERGLDEACAQANFLHGELQRRKNQAASESLEVLHIKARAYGLDLRKGK